MDIYDAGIQAVFGFLTLCMVTIIKQNEKLASHPKLLVRELVIQVCPVACLEYIRIRCRNKLQLYQGDCFEAIKLFRACQERDTAIGKMSIATLSAAMCVDYNIL